MTKLCRHYRTNCADCKRDQQLAIYHLHRNPVESRNARNRLRYERLRESFDPFDPKLPAMLRRQAV